MPLLKDKVCNCELDYIDNKRKIVLRGTKIMNNQKSPLLQRPDYLVCTCIGVMYSDMVQAIKEGAETYQELKEILLVGTGCNSCVVR